MQFQAPYSITDMRRLQMAEEQQKQQQQQAMMEGIGQGIETLMGAYMQNQTDKAQAKAFGDILEMHGPSIYGENAIQLLDRYKKAPLRDQLAMSNMMMGVPGQQLGRMNYLNQQATLYPRNTAGGGAGGAGGGAGVLASF